MIYFVTIYRHNYFPQHSLSESINKATKVGTNRQHNALNYIKSYSFFARYSVTKEAEMVIPNKCPTPSFLYFFTQI